MLTHHWKLLLTSGHITDSLFVMIGGNCNLKRGSSSFNRTHQFAHIDSVQCTNRITFLGPKAFTIVDQDTGQSFQYDNNKTHIFLQSINLSNDKKCDEARSQYVCQFIVRVEKKVHSHHLHRGLIQQSYCKIFSSLEQATQSMYEPYSFITLLLHESAEIPL